MKTYAAISFEEALERGKELYAEKAITQESYSEPEEILRDFAEAHEIDYADHLEIVKVDNDHNETIDSFADFEAELQQLRRNVIL